MTPPAPSAECAACKGQADAFDLGTMAETQVRRMADWLTAHHKELAALRAEVERLRDTLELAVSCIDRVPHPEEDWSWHNKDDPNMEKWAADVKKARSALAGRKG